MSRFVKLKCILQTTTWIFRFTYFFNFRQKEELIKELIKSDKEAKDVKRQYSEKIKSMKQELEKAKRELDESKKAVEEYEFKANYEVTEKHKVEVEYKKKLQTVEAKLQALKRKQKVIEKIFLFGLFSDVVGFVFESFFYSELLKVENAVCSALIASTILVSIITIFIIWRRVFYWELNHS